MKQLILSGLPQFADSPVDAPYEEVALLKDEAEAVRWCIEFARLERGLSQRQIAKLCGWKGDSFLSEIARAGTSKLMPERRLRKFALATGCNLLEQFREKKKTDRQISGRATEQDRMRLAVAAMRASVHPDRRAAA